MSASSPRKRKPVCPNCGSDDVLADAAAVWDVDTQTWDITNVFDSGHACSACGAASITFKWMKVAESVPDAADAADTPSTAASHRNDDAIEFDDVALRQIRFLVGTSRRALEEARSYFDEMTDTAKRAEAAQLLEEA